jgi:hypothetical protein
VTTTTTTPGLDQQFEPPAPSRSPGRLRNYQLAAAAAVLLFALVAIGQLLQVRSDLADRPQLTTQGVRVNQLQAELVRAGRIAAVAPLGGKGDGELEASLATASALVVQAAAAGADPTQLATVNAALGTYGHQLRQAAGGTDAGRVPELLADADRTLTESLQPALTGLSSGVDRQAAGADWLGWALGAGGVLVLCVLAWAWFQSSRLSHRAVNPGLAIAVVLVVGMTVLVVNAAGTASAGASTDALQRAAGLARIEIGVETSAKLQAQAVLAKQFPAESAKAELAARNAATKGVDNTTPDSVRRASSTAVDTLKESAELLAKASWAPAGAVLLGTDGSSLPKNLTALSQASDTAMNDLLSDAEAAPSATSSSLLVVAAAVALLAAAAAVGVIWGIGVRLREYQ